MRRSYTKMFNLSEGSSSVKVVVGVVCEGLVFPGLTIRCQVVTTNAHAHVVNSYCLNWYDER